MLPRSKDPRILKITDRLIDVDGAKDFLIKALHRADAGQIEHSGDLPNLDLVKESEEELLDHPIYPILGLALRWRCDPDLENKVVSYCTKVIELYNEYCKLRPYLQKAEDEQVTKRTDIVTRVKRFLEEERVGG